jgi:hypothetical protein
VEENFWSSLEKFFLTSFFLTTSGVVGMFYKNGLDFSNGWSYAGIEFSVGLFLLWIGTVVAKLTLVSRINKLETVSRRK